MFAGIDFAAEIGSWIIYMTRRRNGLKRSYYEINHRWTCVFIGGGALICLAMLLLWIGF